MTTRRTRLFVLILVTLGIGLAQTASAAPPPPPFYNFEITNETGADITDASVTLVPAVGTAWGTPIVITMSELPNGAKVAVHLPNTYGIAKITANAQCPQPLPSPVEITAPLNAAGNAYTGFTFDMPGSEPDYKPRLIFRKKSGNPAKREAFLASKWRWGAEFSPQPVKSTKTFP